MPSAVGSPGFRRRFFTYLVQDAFNYVSARDHEHPYPERLKRDGWVGQVMSAARGRAANGLRRVAHRATVRRRAPWVERAARELVATAEHLEELEAAYEALADEPSRELFVKLLEWRILGPRRVRLPVSPDYYREGLERIDRELVRERGTRRVSDPYFPELNRYKVGLEDRELTVETDETCMLNTFTLHQYSYEQDHVAVRAERGDVVLDGGGGYGETALYFATSVGLEGEVLCLEMDPRNRRAIQRNRELNPELAARIRVVEAALWESSGVTLDYVAGGKMSRVVEGAVAEGGAIETTTLDELVERNGLRRVNFLKLDVEGSELAVLRGATQTLRDHRPRLAIAVYHDARDIWEIPLYLHGLGLGYRLFLDHTSAGMDETVLFASVEQA